MLVGNNESVTTKNEGESLVISMAMWMRRCERGASPDGAHPRLNSKPLDVAIGRLPEPYCPGGRNGQRIR